ncbi:Primosome assembly protein PriA, partial [Acidiphilium sp. PM]
MALVSVLLPYAFDAAFTYEAREAPPPGAVVTVPLGRRIVHGVVWDDVPEPGIAPARLKTLHAVIATPALPGPLRRFIDWVAQYTMAPRGEVLALALKT